MNLLPDENSYMDDLEEVDEIPIQEIIGIGEAMHPARITILKTEFERSLQLEDRLTSRRRRATRNGNKDLEKIYMDKIVLASRESNRLRGLLDEHERETEPEEIEEYEGLSSIFTFSGHEPDEVRSRPTIQEVEEEEEEEHDLIDELAIVLELEQE